MQAAAVIASKMCNVSSARGEEENTATEELASVAKKSCSQLSIPQVRNSKTAPMQANGLWDILLLACNKEYCRPSPMSETVRPSLAV